MRSLIVGAGEIGTSLYNVLKDFHECYIKDIEPLECPDIEVLNICIPYSNKFEAIVTDYIEQYNPKLTIVHSTVPIGTCRRLGVTHSPVRGKHPNLEKGIRTFIKYIGSPDYKQAVMAQEFLSSAGIETDLFDGPEETEAAKIMSLQYYGLVIAFMKETEKMCKEKGLNFGQVYTTANYDYNNGWSKLEDWQYVRPILSPTPGPIGGHCVIQAGCKLLNTSISRFVKRLNKTYEVQND